MVRKHATHLESAIWARDTLDIMAAPRATAVSRIFLRRTLEWWGAHHAVDDMLTVGSELVANAIEVCVSVDHAGRWRQSATSSLIRLRLLSFASSVAVEVWDRCPAEPWMPPFDLERENGRGLMMVEALSRRWGFYPVHPWGKVVWSELAVSARQAVRA